MKGIWQVFRRAMESNQFLAITVASLPFWAIGQVARDRWWLTGLWFCIPSALPAALLAGWTVYFAARRWWTVAVVSGCLAATPVGMVVFVENHFSGSPVPPGQEQVRLVHWNVAGHLDRAGTRERLLCQRADLYVLSEIEDEAAVEALRSALGEEFQSQVFANLAVIAAGNVRAGGWLIDRHRTKVQQVMWEQGGRTAKLLVVDLPSGIHVARDPILREINRLIEKHRPDLVVGDFNAPRRSCALCDLPEGYRNAYDTAGSGCGYTWPVPLPMWGIDQCIHSSRVVPQRYELQSSMHSDHRMQVFEFGWPAIPLRIRGETR